MRPGIRLGLLLALLGVAGTGWAFQRVVNLTPRVSADFFFASDDPAVAQGRWIERSFVAGGPYLFLSVQGRDIRAAPYVEAVRSLSDGVARLPGVSDVLSITHGPSKLQHAYEGPMWRRLLVDEGSQSTLVIASLPAGVPTPALMDGLERLAAVHTRSGRSVRVSGTPYVSGQIAHHLGRDFQTFSIASFALFGLMILAIYRSLAVLAGTLVACGAAIMLSLIGNALLGGSIGILTANLATIVFVLTQSHIVFLTSNQRRLSRTGGSEARDAAPWAAVRQTLPASAWCMLTTLLGFGSLVLVEAEPLRELGRGGVAGTGLAAVCAYAFYPPFLAVAARRWGAPEARDRKPAGALSRLAARPMALAGIALVCIAGLLGARIRSLDTDPPLLAYFDEHGEIHEGLAFIDRTGGTSVLKLAVRDPAGARLDDRRAYERLWKLQNALEALPGVGAAVSLPVLIAEGRSESFLARLIGVRRLIDLLSGDRLGRVARSFVSESRTDALYLMRMREVGRGEPRSRIIDRMGASARQAGLEIRAVGGIFYLQGRLSELVAESLLRGLAGLLACFLVIALIAARSLRAGLAMTFAIALVPLTLLGALATLRVPVDVISSPAANVCIGMATDSMIHLVASVRRWRAAGLAGWDAWVAARREQGVPILLATLVVCAGFSIFALSSFPPNRRFGLAVVGGSLVAAAATLVVVPLLSARAPFRKPPAGS